MAEDVFRNEPAADFSQAADRESMTAALTTVRASLGQTYPLFINGRDEPGRPTAASINPARPAEVVGHACQATADDLDAAVAAARAAFSTWRETDPEARAAYLLRAASALRSRIWEATALLVFEVGKQWDQSSHDVTRGHRFPRVLRARDGAPCDAGETSTRDPGSRVESALLRAERGRGRHRPLELPARHKLRDGRGGDRHRQLRRLQTFQPVPRHRPPARGHLPRGGTAARRLQLRALRRRSLGDRLVDHADVALIAFTGSREVGLRICERAAKPQPGQRHIKKVITELGGKNAIIVDEGADIEATVPRIVRSAFAFQGQKCSACSRVIVLESVYDEVLERLVSAVRSLRIGPPESYGNDVGPVVDAAAQARIMSYIDSPEVAGRIVYRSEVPDPEVAAGGFYVPVTIVGDVTPADRIAQDELFGPVLAVMRAKDFDHALDLAVSTPFALTGGVFSSSPEQLAKAVVRFRVGNLYLNRAITGAVVGRQPFGGFGLSGGGTKAGGPDYLPHFMNPRVVTERLVVQHMPMLRGQ